MNWTITWTRAGSIVYITHGASVYTYTRLSAQDKADLLGLVEMMGERLGGYTYQSTRVEL